MKNYRSLILASTSKTRGQLLTAAGLAFTAVAPGVDEAELKARWRDTTVGPAAVAQELAAAKAVAVSQRHPEALVIGGDQTLDLDGHLIDKPASLTQAGDHLRALSGRRHSLPTALAVAEAGTVIWRHFEEPVLTMRRLSEAAIENYLSQCGPAVLHSVGAYHIEGLGGQLFSAIEGDIFSIQGLPLLPLLSFLRGHGDIGGMI